MVWASIFFFFFFFWLAVCWNWKIVTVMNYDFVYVIATRATTTTTTAMTITSTTMRRRRCERIRGWLGSCFMFLFCMCVFFRHQQSTYTASIYMQQNTSQCGKCSCEAKNELHGLRTRTLCSRHIAKCATVAQSCMLRERYRIMWMQVIHSVCRTRKHYARIYHKNSTTIGHEHLLWS